MKEKITYRRLSVGGRDISYEWIRKKVKNINLRVRADGTITVSSPQTVSVKEMEAFLTEKANFLFRALDAVEERKKHEIPVPKIADGEKIWLFGEQKILHLVPGKNAKVAEKDGFLTLAESETLEKTQKKLQKYAEKRLLDVLLPICKEVKTRFPEVETFPEIKLRAMRSMWGNCRPRSGILTFNSRLACYPISCIEYIVMHEFSHFIEANHSAAFYEVLSSRMPDWEKRKALLNTIPIKPFF